MTTTLTQRQAFVTDVENALEELSFNVAHLDKKESVENIMYILYALRIASIQYDENELQKNVEALLAMLINHNLHPDIKIVDALYTLMETMIYPYRKSMYIAT
jgi:hypothetical protein